jgi:hypothetical protein
MSLETKLNEILDVDVPTVSSEIQGDLMVVPAPDLTHYANNTVEQDANESRTYIRQSMAQLSTAITEMLAIAKASGKPRAYEVVNNMLKSLAEMHQDLMGSHQSEQVLTQEDAPGEVHNHFENSVFVGSTSELAELVRLKRAERAQREANTITVSVTNAANT